MAAPERTDRERSSRVLLLASDAVTRELVKVYLFEGGAAVVDASDPSAAVGAALHPARVRLAIVDAATHGLDPERLVSELVRAGVQVAALAGASERVVADACVAAGAVAVVPKPVAPEALLAVVEAHLR